MRLLLPDPPAMDLLGAALARSVALPAVLYLEGDLGAGKSTLARALLRTLGVQGAIRSPTYTLVERYPLAGGEAWHLDLYRIADAAELDFLGLDEAVCNLWLIEWPEKGGQGLPPADLHVALKMAGAGREAVLHPTSANGQEWLNGLAFDSELPP